MRNVKWPDNVLSEGTTSIYGIFTGHDLTILLDLCPEGNFTPTFYEPRLPAMGHGRNDLERLKGIDARDYPHSMTLFDAERGYYFTFKESDGIALLTYLKERFPMIRGEGCY